MEGHCSLKAFQLLAESVRQTSQAAAVHPHRQILALNVRGGNLAKLGRADEARLRDSSDIAGAVLTLRADIGQGVGFYDLAVIDAVTESEGNRILIGLHGIGGKLDAVLQALGEVINEKARVVGVALADDVGGNNLRFRVDPNERPDIA
jgi:hypothetical protein